MWTNPVNFRFMADLDGEADEVWRDGRPALQRPDRDRDRGGSSAIMTCSAYSGGAAAQRQRKRQQEPH